MTTTTTYDAEGGVVGTETVIATTDGTTRAPGPGEMESLLASTAAWVVVGDPQIGWGHAEELALRGRTDAQIRTDALLAKEIHKKRRRNMNDVDGYVLVDYVESESGLQAGVWENGSDAVWTAAGIRFTSIADLWTVVRQAFGFQTDQVDEAMVHATQQFDARGGNLRFAGHSFGGALAAMAAIINGGVANIFNSAGVHDNSLMGHSRQRGDIMAWNSSGDWLHYVNYLTPARVPGIQTSVGFAGFHSIDALLQGMP